MCGRTEVELDFAEPVKGRIVGQLTQEYYRGGDKTMAEAVFRDTPASTVLREIADWMDRHDDDVTVTNILVCP